MSRKAARKKGVVTDKRKFVNLGPQDPMDPECIKAIAQSAKTVEKGSPKIGSIKSSAKKPKRPPEIMNSWDFPMRHKKEIIAAENELFDKLWYNRHTHPENTIHPTGPLEPNPIGDMMAADIVRKYGEDEMRQYGNPGNPFAIAYLEGKIAALRWALGMEPNCLDT